MRISVLALLIFGFTAIPVAAAPEQAPRLTVESLMSANANGRRPTQRAWAPDGKHLTYLWDEKGDGKEEFFWRLDAATGQREALLRMSDLQQANAKGEPEALKVSSYAWAPKGDALLLVARGDLYLLPFEQPLDGRKLRRLTATAAAEEDARFSPDGSRIAFVRAFDLYALDVATGRETRLTTDGKENVALNGTNDWLYGEEIWSRAPEGFWWSPDGSRLAFYHFDETPVGVYPLVDDEPLYPKVDWQKYPKAGEPNPRVRIGVVAVTTGRTTWLETGDPEGYLARVAWTPRGDAVAVQRLNRDQNRLDLLRCGAAGAKGACTTLTTETWPTWINLGQDFRFLPDGRFLWGSERDGWRRLYLHGADGKTIRPVTPEGWSITGLDGVAEDGSWAIVTGFPTSELGAIDRRVARVRLGDGQETGGWEVLTPEPGTHVALVAPKTGAWVHVWHDANHPARNEVRTAAGGTVALPDGPPPFETESLPMWEFFTIPGPEGSRLPVRLIKPAGFDPSRRYPVIIYQYGGPGSQVVENAWSPRSLWMKLMAQGGFVGFMVDNQSSIFFGKAGEDRDFRRFGPGNLAGQLAGVEYLKTLPWVDGSRLGLFGWSGGGANTLYCLLKSPGVWKAGVAGAPVSDWKLYDSIWTERYLDRPQDNADGYRDSSAIHYAAELKDRLLIVHGLADDNVHPQNSIVMTSALVAAGRQFEQAFYPGQTHAFHGPSQRNFFQHMTEFFERELMGAGAQTGK